MSAGSRQARALRMLRYTGLKLAEFIAGRAKKKRALQGVQATLLRESTTRTISHLAVKTCKLISPHPAPISRRGGACPAQSSHLDGPTDKLPPSFSKSPPQPAKPDQ